MHGQTGAGSAGGGHVPQRHMEITAMFSTPEFYIAGISPLGANLVLLAYPKERTQEGEALRPQLQIISPYMEYFDEVSNDVLSLRGFEKYHCNDYHLECVAEESLYFVVSPKDVVVARPRTDDDHVAWLLQHNQHQRALDAAVKAEQRLKLHSVQDVGCKYLEHLLSTGKFQEAAGLCVKVLGKNKELWQEQVYAFARLGRLKVLSPYLPRGDRLQLDACVYEMVLNEFLRTDAAGFLALVREWSPSLYSLAAVVNAVIDRLVAEPNQPLLQQALGELYIQKKDFDKALKIYLQLRHKDAFKLIHEHDLFSSISDKIVLLMQFDAEAAVSLLLANLDKIAPEVVVNQLTSQPRLLHMYLDRLFIKEPHNDSGRKFHGLMVGLYAEFEPGRLLAFLRASCDYPLQAALEECQRRQMIAEMVFLLGRMGDTKRALAMIIGGLRDIDRAIAFCKEQDDRDLWEDLIQQSLDKPDFIRVLLHNIGTHVDPILLIQRIRKGLSIPGLRDSLVKILQDYNLQISLREGCKKILVADSFNLLERLTRNRRKGVCVDDQSCPSCQNRIVVNDIRFASNVVVFYCRHLFHEQCLDTMLEHDACPLCSAQKRSPGTAGGAH